MNGSFDNTTVTNKYRAYIGNTTATGNTSTPEANTTPFDWNHLIQVNGSTCLIINATNSQTGTCTFANSTGDLEIGVELGDIGAAANDVLNITFETAGETAGRDH